MIKDEYLALSGIDKNDILFKTEEATLHEDIKPYIAQIKLVKRLREVQVLDGFYVVQECICIIVFLEHTIGVTAHQVSYPNYFH